MLLICQSYYINELYIKNYKDRGRRYWNIKDLLKMLLKPIIILIIAIILVFIYNRQIFGVTVKVPAFIYG